MAWSGPGAFFWDMGVLDFAGGTVVHINAVGACTPRMRELDTELVRNHNSCAQ